MKKIILLCKKFVKISNDDGIGIALKKTIHYPKKVLKKLLVKEKKKNCYKDILFINGCTLEHPSRYRVYHKIEELAFVGYSCDVIFYENIKKENVKNYRAFIFYRCPYTDEIGFLIDLCNKYNKTTFFDIDDLVIDHKYVNEIKYLETMTKSDYDLYMDGVNRMKKTLMLCQHAITSTTKLAEELKKYVLGDVFVNRNIATEEMIKISKDAIKYNEDEEYRKDLSKNKLEEWNKYKRIRKNKEQIIIGYFSGSITHNDDFELIKQQLIRVVKKYENVYLAMAGLIDIPEDLKEIEEKIIKIPFMDWKLLPKVIYEVDINICPLIDNIFNQAKSENKWMEAALVKTCTVGSNIGALRDVIKDEIDGILCKNNEWEEKLSNLIENKNIRDTIAKNAYIRVLKEYTSKSNSYKLSKFIEDRLSKNIAFVLPSTKISGGVNVVLKHCSILIKRGYDVLIINMYDDSKNINFAGEEINVISIFETEVHSYIDTAVATLWTTVQFVNNYTKIRNKKYLVQNYETNFYEDGNLNRIFANITYNAFNDLKYITISKWCQDWLYSEFEKKSLYAQNGIDLSLFKYKKRDFSGKIRILIEGNSDDYYKNVDESFKIVEHLDKEKFEIWYLSYQGKGKKWYKIDKFYNKVSYDKVGEIYSNCHILIKSSILESFSYPPLEMMATGGLVVVRKNEGNIEYIRHMENALMYDEDYNDAVSYINMIIKENALRDSIINNALETAKSRSWDNIEEEIVKLYE